MQAKQNLSTSTFEPEKQVRAIVIVVRQYSMLVYVCAFDKMSAIKCEIYDPSCKISCKSAQGGASR